MNPLPEPSINTEFVAPLGSLRRKDLDHAGGKGANLGELVGAGFPVPPGFVITTAAYDRFVQTNGLDQTINQALAKQEPKGVTIRSAFENASIPPELEGDVRSAYQQLGQGPVAVRSSATAEDLPEAAFAGQQDTYLNVIGPEALLDAIQRCWASLWTERAIAYRERQGVDQRTVKLAVVVQSMVEADSAGVMFTANPVTGARDEVVIDASPGLGEAVVSGLVTPDHFILRKQRRGWSIVEHRAGRSEVVIRGRAGGGTVQVEGTAGNDNGALPAKSLDQLAGLGAAIQDHFGSPQDVEWAWAAGKLFILQARPITALPEPPPHASRLERMVASNFGELFSVRPYPLDMDTWIPALAGAIEPLFEMLGFDWQLNNLFEVRDGVTVRFNNQLPRLTWRNLLAPARLISLILRYDPLHWQADPLVAETQARAQALESADTSTLSWKDMFAVVSAADAIPRLGAGELRRRYFPRAAFALVRLRILLAMLGHANKLAALLSGVENKTLEVNHALERMADQVRSDPVLTRTFSTHTPGDLLNALEGDLAGRAFLSQLVAFLDHYGHREAVISTALEPTWKDSPEVVLGLIKSFYTHPPAFQSGKPAWQAVRDELLQHPLLRAAPLRAVFLKLLAEARVLLQIREDTHFYATLSLPLLRRTFLEIGRRLVQTGILDTPEEVFHLRLAELEQIGSRWPPSEAMTGELRTAVMRRKNERSRLENVPLVDPRLFFQRVVEGEPLLRGMPGSPGVAEGPVCIVRGGYEFDKLVPGDVLVAPYTNPSWTPLFQRAAAVVVDTGSMGSHAAIVAREYGIPAVMSTRIGTQTLRDGDRIQVDGSRGAVLRVTSDDSGQELAGGPGLTR